MAAFAALGGSVPPVLSSQVTGGAYAEVQNHARGMPRKEYFKRCPKPAPWRGYGTLSSLFRVQWVERSRPCQSGVSQTSPAHFVLSGSGSGALILTHCHFGGKNLLGLSTHFTSPPIPRYTYTGAQVPDDSSVPQRPERHDREPQRLRRAATRHALGAATDGGRDHGHHRPWRAISDAAAVRRAPQADRGTHVRGFYRRVFFFSCAYKDLFFVSSTVLEFCCVGRQGCRGGEGNTTRGGMRLVVVVLRSCSLPLHVIRARQASAAMLEYILICLHSLATLFFVLRLVFRKRVR